MELKILYLVDERKQFYTCTGCRQTLEVTGTVLSMYTCPATSFGRERNWVPIPTDSLRDSP
ncbi:MAG TPA: hypothetical protein VFR18_15835 [Terriglobia bacterium]|nr:hypothetical protein [Terriglobia bacterium]